MAIACALFKQRGFVQRFSKVFVREQEKGLASFSETPNRRNAN
jgi:hypothetical protein